MTMDWAKLLNPARIGRRPAKDEIGRSPFNSDHDKVVFSGAFRRLARKTQVHPLSSNDHIHNRLTHSLEVACVGRSLGIRVGQELQSRQRLPEAVLPSDIGDIVQTACLAHDIGNPPFGHTGEEAIRYWFSHEGESYLTSLSASEKADLLHFEGNAQGLRVLLATEYHPYDGGMRLTYATLASFIKYPWTSLAAEEKRRPKRNKYGVFQSELAAFEEIAEAVGLLPKDGENWYCRHPLVHLMEVADDFCYGLIDLEDGLEMEILRWDEIFEILEPVLAREDVDKLRLELAQVPATRRPPLIRGKVIEAYLDAARVAFVDNEADILAGKHDDILSLCAPTVRNSVEAAKNMAKQRIFAHPRKLELEIGAYNTIAIIMNVLCDAACQYVHHPDKLSFREIRAVQLIGIDTFEHLFADADNGRNSRLYLALMRVVDYVSGMTDQYATYLAKQFSGMAESR